MIVIDIAPGVVGVKVVVVGAALIRFVYGATGFLFGHIVTSHEGFNPLFGACIKEKLDKVRIVAENIVSTPSHDNAGAFLCN